MSLIEIFPIYDILMKKTSIYILSILVITVLALSVILPSHRILKIGVEAFMEGFNMGSSGEDLPENLAPVKIDFTPSTSTMIQPTDSIEFADGRRLPFVIDNVIVMAPTDSVPQWTRIVTFLILPFQFILLFIILWKLIRFILNVSKEKIFVIRNVNYLRQISVCLLAIALLQIFTGLIEDYTFKQFHFTWPGYDLGAYWQFPWGNLLFGVIGLLFAQVWAYGLQIKQDQELTI